MRNLVLRYPVEKLENDYNEKDHEKEDETVQIGESDSDLIAQFNSSMERIINKCEKPCKDIWTPIKPCKKEFSFTSLKLKSAYRQTLIPMLFVFIQQMCSLCSSCSVRHPRL